MDKQIEFLAALTRIAVALEAQTAMFNRHREEDHAIVLRQAEEQSDYMKKIAQTQEDSAKALRQSTDHVIMRDAQHSPRN